MHPSNHLLSTSISEAASSVAIGGGIGSNVSSFMCSCTEITPSRLASTGMTVFEGLLRGSGIAKGDLVKGVEVDGGVGDGDAWLIAADADGMFHLGSATHRGS